MNEFTDFTLFEQQASSLSGWIDILFFSMVALSTLVVVGVFIALTTFAIKYRRGSRADRSHPLNRSMAIEDTWTVVPLVLFIGIFVWAATLYYDLLVPPKDTLDIFIVGKQWMWKVQHPQGRREINELHVPLGHSVKLVMTSEDVIHSFFVPAFRVKQDVIPSRYTTLWFTPTQLGEFPLFCAEYCGTNHSRMGGKVVVMNPSEYERWLHSGNLATGMAAAGAERFREHGCSGCHGQASSVHAPKLEGLFGKPVPLESGGTVVVDERYIRDSILLPQKEIVAGYEPIMPSFQGQIDEENILEIIAYIKSLGQNKGSTL